MNQKIALQLYSLRNRIDGGFKAQLRRLAAIGYQGVEFAGMHEIPAPELQALLLELGLVPVGAHTPLNELENAPERVIAYHREIGTGDIVVPYAEFHEEADVERIVSLSRKIAPKVRAAGMRLLYHNHSQEFTVKFGGKTVLELLRERTAPEELGFELDVFWATYAGYDPVEVIEQFGERCKMVHAKDMNNLREKKMTEVGAGIIDFSRILSQCDKMGHPWVIVEQDEIEMEEYESVKISLQHLQKL